MKIKTKQAILIPSGYYPADTQLDLPDAEATELVKDGKVDVVKQAEAKKDEPKKDK